MTIALDEMDTVAAMVVSMAEALKISTLESHAVFPKDAERVNKMIADVSF